MEKKTFGEPVQTATVVGAAYGIHRTTLTQAAKAGVLGRSAYRSGDAWLIKTDHPDFWEWVQEHEYHPRVKGYRKQQAAKAAQQGLLEEAEKPETVRGQASDCDAAGERLRGPVPRSRSRGRKGEETPWQRCLRPW
ncbi:hypothetical protein [Dictyobacter kobayashii]|uniref:Uncharacterized protein n=1 Tax=Dictyobacter kobayashii TaxID=2014872 RepID=A0A402AAK6_9CHLR|nr:hypothetical protein [Dictyobacter kobayashii]GCE16203.1 hypothetical protein KDK_00030 [Dictyobacter kobayashii]